MSRARAIPLSFALLAGGALGQEPPRLRTASDYFPVETCAKDAAGNIVAACRLVDARTGRPVAGAEVFAVEESRNPVAGRFWFTHRVVSDAEGFVRVPQATPAQPWGWLIVRANGFGPSGHMGMPGLVWALSPGVDVEIAVRDWLDRPVPGAGLGLCLGCGHSPDVANATADARGIARFPGIDPHNEIADFYPEHPDLGIEHYDGIRWWPGDPPAILRAPHGVPVRGRVLDERGAPVAGAFVGTPDKHRGPWTTTAANGTFQLDGAPDGFDLYVHVDGHEFLFERAATPEVELRLPAWNGEPTQVVELQHSEVRATLTATIVQVDGKPAAGLEVAAHGPWPAASSAAQGTTAADGTLTLDLPVGDYDLRCADAAFARQLGRVRVARDGTRPARLSTVALPTVRLRAPAGASVELLEDGDATDVTAAVAAGTAVPVRSDRPFGFHLRDEATGDERWFAGEPAMLQQQEPVALAFFPPTRVSGRLVDEQGNKVAARVAILGNDACLRGDAPFDPRAAPGELRADGTFAFAERGRSGLAFLAVLPEAKELPPLLLPIHLPWRGPDAQLDPGSIVLPAAPQLVVRDRDGKALPSDRIGFFRAGWCEVQDRHLVFRTDEQGRWLGPRLQKGDAIVVPAAHWDLDADDVHDGALDLPFRTVLAGDGPWSIDVPAGELRVDAHAADGTHARVVLFVQDRSVACDGPVVLRQLPPGPLHLLVASEGHAALVADVAIPGRGRVDLPIVLPPR